MRSTGRRVSPTLVRIGRALRAAVALALLATAVCAAGAVVFFAGCARAAAPVHLVPEGRPHVSHFFVNTSMRLSGTNHTNATAT
jgi:hypothetical protein